MNGYNNAHARDCALAFGYEDMPLIRKIALGVVSRFLSEPPNPGHETMWRIARRWKLGYYVTAVMGYKGADRAGGTT